MSHPLGSRPFVERWRKMMDFFRRGIWRIDQSPLSAPRAGLLRMTRVVLLTGRGFLQDKCLMRAGSLTYVTIFSLVPLLAFTFAVAKGLNADEYLQKRFIEPLLNETFGFEQIEEASAGASQVVEPASEPPTVGAADAGESGAAEPGAEADAGETLPAAQPDVEVASSAGAQPSAEGSAEGSAEAAPSPAGAQLRLAIDQIFRFVRETNFTSLGAFSLAFLLYCVIKLLGAMEHALNDIWGLRTTRSFTRRVTNYLAIVVMTPIVVITATGVTAMLQEETLGVLPEGFDPSPLIALLPFAVVSAGMTFLYVALPNTRVRLASAIFGGIVAGCCWQLAQILHVQFQIGVARINAIYSGFAALPLFLLWVYVNWSLLLLGAQLAYAHQNEPLQTSIAQSEEVDQSYREGLALRLAGRVTAAFLAGQRAPSVVLLAGDLGVTPRLVTQVLQSLVEHGVLARTDEEPDQGYLPARRPGSIRVLDVLHAMRREAGAEDLPVRSHLDERVDRILDEIDRELAGSHVNQDLAQLARALVREDEQLTVGGEEARTRPGLSTS